MMVHQSLESLVVLGLHALLDTHMHPQASGNLRLSDDVLVHVDEHGRVNRTWTARGTLEFDRKLRTRVVGFRWENPNSVYNLSGERVLDDPKKSADKTFRDASLYRTL